MKQLSALTREQLEDIVGRIRDILWRDPVTGALDPDRSWDVEAIEWVSGVIENAGLKPYAIRPASPTPRDHTEEPSATAMRSALEALIRTIEATGGCIRPGRTDVGLPDAEILDSLDDHPVPAADEDWPDLADAYFLACRALGQEPMVRDAEDDEVPDDGEDADDT